MLNNSKFHLNIKHNYYMFSLIKQIEINNLY